MGIATLLAAPVIENWGFQRWVRISFLANALVTPLIAHVHFYPEFSETLLLLAIPWTITAPLAMLLPALLFKKEAGRRTIRGRCRVPGAGLNSTGGVRASRRRTILFQEVT